MIVRSIAGWLFSGVLVAGAGCAARYPSAEPSLGVSRESSTGDIASIHSEPIALPIAQEPWQFGDQQGIVITTPNYRIFTTINNNRILERLPHFYEGVLKQYVSAIARLPVPTGKMDSYLFQTRSQWQDKTLEMLPDQAGMFSNLGRGGFTTRGISVLYYIDRYGYTRDTFAIAAHEGWHQYTQRTFKHQLPIWLEEGVATYMEGYRTNREGVMEFAPRSNFERREALRDAVRRNRLIALEDLLTRTPQSFLNNSKDALLTYYAQVWALTLFLAEGEDSRYRSSLEMVLADAAEGRMVNRVMASAAGDRRSRSGLNRVGPAVVREYFNRDFAEFQSQYLSFIEQLLQARPESRPARPTS